jgi:hypothetical protein
MSDRDHHSDLEVTAARGFEINILLAGLVS